MVDCALNQLTNMLGSSGYTRSGQIDNIDQSLDSRQVAFGTTTEPTYWPVPLGGDKHWGTDRDITHLKSLLQPGAAVLIFIDNNMDNTYYVPIWAQATLELLYGNAQLSESYPNDILPLLTASSAGPRSAISGVGDG